MSDVTQNDRIAAIGTPLGDDVLLFRVMEGHEELGRPFKYELELQSKSYDIKFEDIVGQNVTIRFLTQKEKNRYINGYVSRFAQIGIEGTVARYHMTIVPWLWFLTRTADCRIFQEMTVPDIIKQVFRDHGFSDFKDDLTGTYREWEYCVQYRESYFNFVSRLMEHEGIYYYFQHEDGKHTLVLTDSSASHSPFPDYETIPYRPPNQNVVLQEEHIFEWMCQHEVQSGMYVLNAFDFSGPNKSLEARSQIIRNHAVPDFEVYDYPGAYTQYSDGENYAKVRIEELQSQFAIMRGASIARGICAGYTFTLADHPRSDQKTDFLVTSVDIKLATGDYGSAAGLDASRLFICTFTARQATEPFRSAQITPKPLIRGPQTAIVVGKKGEEIWTDKYGRVKVMFHWDRDSEANEKSSCWIRVSHAWAGKKWGQISLPRIGQEVIIDFLEGDPDRPIITGRVYNGESMPPYTLPDFASMSTNKSNSTKDGSGFNEIRFEDKKKAEQIFIHAQNRMDERVRGSRYETNYGNREIRVGWEKDGDRGGDLNTFVRKDVNYHIEEGQYELIDKAINQTIKEDVIESFEKNQSTMIKENSQLNAKEIVVEGSSLISHKSGKITIEGTQAVHVKGGQVNIEGQQGISLKCGGNFVVVDMSGVAINGSTVMINSGGCAQSAEAAKSAESVEIEEPFDAAVADDGKPGKKRTGKRTPRTRNKVTLNPQKAPPYVPPKPPSTLPGGGPGGMCVAPVPVSTSACGISELVVTDPESGGKNRTPNSSNVLQIVAAADVVANISRNIGEYVKISGSEKTVGKDELKIEVKVVDEAKAKRKQIAVTRSSTPTDWQDKGKDTAIIKPPANNDLWPSDGKPEIYYVHGRGCDDIYQTVKIESFPSQIHELSVETSILSKLIEEGTNQISKFLENLFGSLLKFKADAMNGKASAKWGWKEADDWQAFFAGEVTVGFDPYIAVTATITGDLLQLAGTALGIPPAISRFAPQIFVSGSVTGAIKLTGTIEKTGPSQYEGKIGPTGVIEFKMEIGAKYESFLVSAGLVGGAKTSIELPGEVKWKSEGIFIEAALEWKGLTVYYKLYFATGELEEKEDGDEFDEDGSADRGQEWVICGPRKLWEPKPVKLFGK